MRAGAEALPEQEGSEEGDRRHDLDAVARSADDRKPDKRRQLERVAEQVSFHAPTFGTVRTAINPPTNAKHRLSASEARMVVSIDCLRKLEMMTGRPNATAL